jgi:hypothetical protein
MSADAEQVFVATGDTQGRPVGHRESLTQSTTVAFTRTANSAAKTRQVIMFLVFARDPFHFRQQKSRRFRSLRRITVRVRINQTRYHLRFRSAREKEP